MSKQRTITTPADIGEVVAAVRIAQGIRADELSLSHVFVGSVEKGKETSQIGKVLQLLNELGIAVTLEAPPGVTLPTDAKSRRKRISR